MKSIRNKSEHKNSPGSTFLSCLLPVSECSLSGTGQIIRELILGFSFATTCTVGVIALPVTSRLAVRSCRLYVRFNDSLLLVVTKRWSLWRLTANDILYQSQLHAPSTPSHSGCCCCWRWGMAVFRFAFTCLVLRCSFVSGSLSGSRTARRAQGRRVASYLLNVIETKASTLIHRMNIDAWWWTCNSRCFLPYLSFISSEIRSFNVQHASVWCI